MNIVNIWKGSYSLLLYFLAFVISLSKQLVLAAVKLFEAGTGDFKTVLWTQSTDAPQCFLAQVPSFQGHGLLPSKEEANKTGGKACVHSVAASLIHVVKQKQMSWVSTVYQALGKMSF